MLALVSPRFRLALLLALAVAALFATAPREAASLEGRSVECVIDGSLSRAAWSVVEGRRSPTGAELTAIARAADCDLPALHALVLEPGFDPMRVDRWLADLRSRSDAPLVCGVAEDPSRRVIVAASRAGGLEWVDASRGLIRASLDASFRDPRLLVLDARGAVREIARGPELLSRDVHIEHVAAPYVVQLLASGPHGPRPVAERTVGGEWLGASTADGLGEALEALRSSAGVSGLRANALLDRVARDYAATVLRERRVAHVDDASGDPVARLRARGVEGRAVGEAIACSDTEAGAFAALARSPSHRATLLDRRFTDFGLGLASTADPSRHCLVLMFVAWPRVR